jgi:hypothetical protein
MLEKEVIDFEKSIVVGINAFTIQKHNQRIRL